MSGRMETGTSGRGTGPGEAAGLLFALAVGVLAAAPWIRIVEHQGLDEAAKVVRALADGVSDAAEGAVGRIVR